MVARMRAARVSHSSGRRMKSSVGQVRVHAIREHDEMESDQPHVVGERHPGETHVVLVEAPRLGATADVGENVAVGEHYALRVTRRAGGELDEGDVIGTDALHAAWSRDVIEVIDQERAAAQAIEQLLLARLCSERTDALERTALGVEKWRAQAPRDSQQLVAVLV